MVYCFSFPISIDGLCKRRKFCHCFWPCWVCSSSSTCTADTEFADWRSRGMLQNEARLSDTSGNAYWIYWVHKVLFHGSITIRFFIKLNTFKAPSASAGFCLHVCSVIQTLLSCLMSSSLLILIAEAAFYLCLFWTYSRFQFCDSFVSWKALWPRFITIRF